MKSRLFCVSNDTVNLFPDNISYANDSGDFDYLDDVPNGKIRLHIGHVTLRIPFIECNSIMTLVQSNRKQLI